MASIYVPVQISEESLVENFYEKKLNQTLEEHGEYYNWCSGDRNAILWKKEKMLLKVEEILACELEM